MHNMSFIGQFGGFAVGITLIQTLLQHAVSTPHAELKG